MLCDVCKCNDATVFLTQILEGKMQKVNLCDACSKEKGVQDPTGFALADLLLGIGAAEEIEKGGPTQKCPVCGVHFVAAGGQVKSMLSWLGYVKHGEPQPRVFLLKMPPPNLKPDFEDQARSFVDGLVDEVLAQRTASGAESSTIAHSPA